MAISLDELATWADQRLSVDSIPDYPPARNGLQLENDSGKVSRVVSAVDACETSIAEATAAGADLLVVHHGLFWSGIEPVSGAVFRKLKAAMDGGLAIYSAHLPLDVHPELGNNACLARALGFDPASMGKFLEFKGLEMGLSGEGGAESRSQFVERVAAAVAGPVHCAPGGPEQIGRVGIVTGGAGSEVAAAHAAGIDTFVTGEGPHWSYTLAEELGINLLYAGHYATETFGVKALAAELADKFGIEDAGFLAHPTGL